MDDPIIWMEALFKWQAGIAKIIISIGWAAVLLAIAYAIVVIVSYTFDKEE